jgi:hypothetical protein
MFIYRADNFVNETLKNLSSRGNQPNEIIIIEFEIIIRDTVIATCKTSIFFNKFSSSNAKDNCKLKTYHGHTWGVGCQYIGTFSYVNNSHRLNGLFTDTYRLRGGNRTLMMLNTDLFNHNYEIVNSKNYDSFVPNKDTERTILASVLVEAHNVDHEEVMKGGIEDEHVLISNDILPIITMEFIHSRSDKAEVIKNIIIGQGARHGANQDYQFEGTIYVESINFLKVTSGIANIVFST